MSDGPLRKLFIDIGPGPHLEGVLAIGRREKPELYPGKRSH